jgi:hypothetical protein
MHEAIGKENARRILHAATVAELRAEAAARKKTWQETQGKEQRRETRTAWIAANTALREGSKGLRKATGPATQKRINDTLSSALSNKRLFALLSWHSASIVGYYHVTDTGGTST